MAMIKIEPSFEQLENTIRQLPLMQQVRLWRVLDAELNQDEIRRRAAEAVETIRAANEEFTEAEVMADVNAALAEVRAARAARGR